MARTSRSVVVSLALLLAACASSAGAREITPPGKFWADARLSENGRYVLLAQGTGENPQLYVWSRRGLRATGQRGLPLEIADDGRSFVSECGSSVCLTSPRGTRRILLAPYWKPNCPHASSAYFSLVIRVAPGGRFLLVNCASAASMFSLTETRTRRLSVLRRRSRSAGRCRPRRRAAGTA